MPTESHKAHQNWTAEERLVAERAILLHRQVRDAMQNAPYGQGLAVTEAAVVGGGRQFLQKMLQEALSAQPRAQKGGSAPAPAIVATTPLSRPTAPKR